MSENAYKYDIAIVIPVKNEARFIGQTLDQIYLQDFPMDKIEIVIAEGGSSDRTREIVEPFKDRFGSLKVLDNPKQLPSSGRNIGIKNSSAPYIVILDGHTYIPTKNYLKEVVATFERTRAECICRPRSLRAPDISDFQLAVAVCRSSALGHKPSSEVYSEYEGEVDPTSSGAIYRRTVFNKIGYFDEDFDAGEDLDFNYRIELAGLKAYLTPALKVYYYPLSTLEGLWRQMNRYGKGRFKFARKHHLYSPVQWLSGATVFLMGLMAIIALASPTVYSILETSVALYLLVILTGCTYLSLKERNLECLLFGPLIFPTIHFGLGVGFLRAMFFTLSQGDNDTSE